MAPRTTSLPPSPHQAPEVEPLLHAFGLVPTPKTAEVAAGIAPRPSRYPDLVGQLPEPMQREIAETTDALRSRKPD